MTHNKWWTFCSWALSRCDACAFDKSDPRPWLLYCAERTAGVIHWRWLTGGPSLSERTQMCSPNREMCVSLLFVHGYRLVIGSYHSNWHKPSHTKHRFAFLFSLLAAHRKNNVCLSTPLADFHCTRRYFFPIKVCSDKYSKDNVLGHQYTISQLAFSILFSRLYLYMCVDPFMRVSSSQDVVRFFPLRRRRRRRILARRTNACECECMRVCVCLPIEE